MRPKTYLRQFPGNTKLCKGGGRGGGGASKSRSPTIPNGVTARPLGKSGTNYLFTIDGKQISLTVGKFGPNEATVNFDVDGQKSRGALQGPSANQAALKLAKIIKYDAATRPDGFTYEAEAHELGDRAGGERVNIYQKLGFSEPRGITKTQSSIVRNGKLTPG